MSKLILTAILLAFTQQSYSEPVVGHSQEFLNSMGIPGLLRTAVDNIEYCWYDINAIEMCEFKKH